MGSVSPSPSTAQKPFCRVARFIILMSKVGFSKNVASVHRYAVCFPVGPRAALFFTLFLAENGRLRSLSSQKTREDDGQGQDRDHGDDGEHEDGGAAACVPRPRRSPSRARRLGYRTAEELVIPILGPAAQELDLLPVLDRLDCPYAVPPSLRHPAATSGGATGSEACHRRALPPAWVPLCVAHFVTRFARSGHLDPDLRSR